MILYKATIEVYRFCLDGEPPSCRHGVPRVGGKVHKYLVDLGYIRLDSYIGLGKGYYEFYVLGEESLEQLLRFSHYFIDLSWFELYNLLPAEGEKALGEDGSLLGRCENLVHVLSLGVIPHAGLQEASVPDDCSEDIVEIVSNAACEGAHSFHLLGVKELGFEVFPGRSRPSDRRG